MRNPQFYPGDVFGTPAALAAIERNGQTALQFLDRHLDGDWGDCDAEDAKANEDALISGARLMSVYHLKDGEAIWIITEAADEEGNREATTILLPSDY